MEALLSILFENALRTPVIGLACKFQILHIVQSWLAIAAMECTLHTPQYSLDLLQPSTCAFMFPRCQIWACKQQHAACSISTAGPLSSYSLSYSVLAVHSLEVLIARLAFAYDDARMPRNTVATQLQFTAPADDALLLCYAEYI